MTRGAAGASGWDATRRPTDRRGTPGSARKAPDGIGPRPICRSRALLPSTERREFLRLAEARAAPRTPLGHRDPLANAIFDWTECWYKPQAATQLLQNAQPHRLRDRNRGMIATTHPSAETGEA